MKIPNAQGIGLALVFSGMFFLAAYDDVLGWRPDKLWMAGAFSLLFVAVAVTAGVIDARADRRRARQERDS
jgi:hypothetical protein